MRRVLGGGRTCSDLLLTFPELFSFGGIWIPCSAWDLLSAKSLMRIVTVMLVQGGQGSVSPFPPKRSHEDPGQPEVDKNSSHKTAFLRHTQSLTSLVQMELPGPLSSGHAPESDKRSPKYRGHGKRRSPLGTPRGSPLQSTWGGYAVRGLRPLQVSIRARSGACHPGPVLPAGLLLGQGGPLHVGHP